MDAELHNRIQKSLEYIVTKNLKNGVFSACSVGYFEEKNSSVHSRVYHYGGLGKVLGSEPVDDKTIFDLASLTKPLVTSLCIQALVESGNLKLHDPVHTFFDVHDGLCKQMKVIHLLEHTSGLPAHREYFTTGIKLPEDEREAAILKSIVNEELMYEPGRGEVYSDLGYILLGKIVEKISGEKLDRYWEKTIVRPLGLEKGLFFNRNQKVKGKIFPATGICQWSNKELSGVVNDDNCRSLGGVEGHAGLFGSADALLKLMAALMKMYTRAYTHPNLSFEVMRNALHAKSGRWVLGFDTPSRPVSSSGKYFSDKTIGHLGFTGTSFWLDCTKRRGVVLLTNRVLCGEDLTPIRKFRPQVHDAILKELSLISYDPCV